MRHGLRMLGPLILLGGAVVTALADPVPGQGTWDDPQLGLQGRDINGDGIADAFFDPALNITWLADAGRFLGNWDDAMAWAEGLEVYGVTGWRLPALADVADSCNSPPSPDSSEWTHMFFVTLGNSKSCGGGISALTNAGPFDNLTDSEAYWSANEVDSDPTGARDFFTYFGEQSAHPKWINLYAWAVREGDVGQAVVLVDQLGEVPPSNFGIVATPSDFDTPFQIADGFEFAVGQPAQITRVQWLGLPPLGQAPSGEDSLTFAIRFFRQVEAGVEVLPLSGAELGTSFSETATSHPALTLYSAELSPPVVLPGDGSYFISIVANSPGSDSDWLWFFLDGPTMAYGRVLDSQPWEERRPRSYSFRLFGGPVPPRAVEAGGPYAGAEGEDVIIAAALDGPDDGSVAYLWSVSDARCIIADPTAASTTVTCTDDGSYPLTVTVSDGGTLASDNATLEIGNVAPDIAITAPEAGAVLPISTAVQVMASLSDAGALDNHTCTVDFGDGASEPAACDTTNGITASPHTYAEAGVYEIWVTAADDDGGVSYESVLVVIYDPSAGFVTGGGWIDSPAGAYAGGSELAGRANFGFVSRYKRGAGVPDGNTQFMFQAGALNFHSSAYQWLVVTGGKAQFKGVGTINGSGSYGFLIFATDAEATSRPDDLDTFRIRIWDREDGDEPVYDNGAEQAIGGGSIVVHAGRDK